MIVPEPRAAHGRPEGAGEAEDREKGRKGDMETSESSPLPFSPCPVFLSPCILKP
jgi:hypothetical protein